MSTTYESNSYREANKHDCLIKAMNYVMDALKHNKIWIFLIHHI